MSCATWVQANLNNIDALTASVQCATERAQVTGLAR
jgi:hypothetical protein